MLPTFLAAVSWIPPLVGLGALLRHRSDARLRFGLAGLIGLGVAGVVALWVNFVAAVTPPLAAGLWITGSALVVIQRRWIFEAFDAREGIAILAIVGAASIALRHPAFEYDTGFYHLQTLQWITRDSAYLGLANVHFRLGFNSLWHLSAAALEHPFVVGRSYAFANVLPIAFAGALGVAGARSVLSGEGSVSTLLLAAGFLPAASGVIALGGLYADYTAAMYAYVAIALWARAAERDDLGDGTPAMLLSVLATLVKLSAGVLPAAGLAFLVARRRRATRRMWGIVAAVVLLAVLPWIGRGVVLSGCLAFPLPATCVSSISWAVPESAAISASTSIRSFARGTAAGDRGWLQAWRERVLDEYPDVIVMLWAFGGGLVGCALARGARRGLLTASGLGALGTVAWFISAPDPRFGIGFLWALSLAPAAYVAGAVVRGSTLPGARLAVVIVPIVCAIVLGGVLTRQERRGMLYNLPPWTADVLEWPPLPAHTDVAARTTRSGVRVFIPVEGERCWNAPLPCTPAQEYDPALGFDGVYFMQR